MLIPISLQRNAMVIGSSSEGGVPPELRPVLESAFQYDHRIFLRGREAYDAFGNRRNVKIVPTKLWLNEAGCIVTRQGFLPKAKAIIEQFGMQWEVKSYGTHPRSDRYKLDWDGVFRMFEPRAGQAECLVSMVDNPTGGYIEAPPGYGKSHQFRFVPALYPNANICIVVTRKDIAREIHRGLTAHYPNVGLCGDGKRREGRITVAMAQSLQYVSANTIDILLCDEAHELLTDNYCTKLTEFCYARNYGFSASPTGRADNADLRMEWIFGPRIYYMSYQEALELSLVVPVRVVWYDVEMDTNPAADLYDTSRQRKGIWRNAYRNAMIAEVAMSYPPDDQVLIMVRSLEHAAYLKTFLPEFTLCYSEGSSEARTADIEGYKRIGLIPADEPTMTWERRQFLKEQFSAGLLKKVIATDIWSTGVNFHQLQVLIRADAQSTKKSDEQLPGRVTRPSPATGKAYGEVVDFMDHWDSGFLEASKTRKRHYREKGWEQVDASAEGYRPVRRGVPT